MMKRIFFYLIGVLSFFTSHSQNTIGLPSILNYGSNDHMAGNQTWDITQDADGILYFANSRGLLTFDGSHWKNHPLPNKTILRSILVGDKNKIYAGGQDELGYFIPDHAGALEYHSLKKLIPESYQQFADIWDIEPFGESIFFRATDRIFEFNNQSIRVYPSASEWRFIKKVDERLLAQDKQYGLLEFKQDAWHPVITGPFNDLLISGMIPFGSDSILISTLKEGLFILSNNRLHRMETDMDESLKRNLIYTMIRISDSELALGTTSEGCYIMNRQGRTIQEISGQDGLQNSNVLCLFLDRDENIWAGLNRGISYIAYSSAIKYIRPNKTNDLSGYTSLIYKDSLYIATSDGGYIAPFSKQEKDLSFSKGPFTRIKNSTGQVWNIEVINQQVLMGYNDGAYIINGHTAAPIFQGEGVWLFKPLSPILPSKNILSGTYTGLQLMNYDENKFFNVGKIEGINESLRFLEIDNHNAIWSSHPYRGVYKITLADSNVSFKAELMTTREGLPSNLGNYVFKIKNRIVFATEKGVYEYNAAEKQFKPSEFLNPVFNGMEVRYLREDPEGNIWFCANNKTGYVRFNTTKSNSAPGFTLTYFPELTGKTIDGSENIFPFDRQNIFIAAENGVVHLNLQKYQEPKSLLKTHLSQIRAIGKSDSLIFGGYTPARQASAKITLPAAYHSFHFAYSSPSYSLQKNIEYSYQLKGYDKKWSEWSFKTEKDYTNLPSGKYTFNVKSRDNLGRESEISTYSFEILPPWYATIPMKIIYLVLILILLRLLYKYQQMKFKKQQKKFEEEQRRLKEIHQLKLEKNQKEILQLQNEKLANEIKFKSRELADANLHLVERTDALSRVKDELETLYKKTNNNHDVKKALQLVGDVEKNNANWEQFVFHFNEVNNDFLNKLKARFPGLSKTDLKVCAYLQLNLSSKEIAQLMNISLRGVEVARYRLRKKLNLEKHQHLNDFLNSIK